MTYFTRMAILVTLLVLTLALGIPEKTVFAHGGKTHGDGTVTAFSVVKKATGLYGRLISNGKLDTSWETNLQSVTAYPQQRGDKKEWVVKFLRSTGDPEAVYIFFSNSGEYTGSNHTGK